uniref:30S ribosomal protein S9, chloroplastic n=1 Tax=Strombidium inclinatum TaxID=197538 RepID=A0A7S3MZR1_9SPIT|mmetsp:Transcript_33386/g.51217  ORF Transcript_33386/g.51217 Transcript_33386/m.51217 type:complete len:145 (+) Transcript_33386:56-490(+)
MSDEKKQVRTFGRKKNATAVALCQEGKGMIRVNGKPLHLIEPASMVTKVYEPLFILGANKFEKLSIRVRVNGGGAMAQVMAVRMAIAKAVIAFAQKYEDEQTKREMKELLTSYDKQLIVSDSRRCEPKKFGGKGARARFQKSYR